MSAQKLKNNKFQLEKGVQSGSERFFHTPSALAREMFLYITRCGHYYCGTGWNFDDSNAIGKEISHLNYLLDFVVEGRVRAEIDGTSCIAEAGQILISDCRKRHRFYTDGKMERIWFHFDGAGASAFFNKILAQNGGRHVITPFAGSKMQDQFLHLISQAKSDFASEAQMSKSIYNILCDLVIPPFGAKLPPEEAAQQNSVLDAMLFINAHLFENITVDDMADAAGLSHAHFSRIFKRRTGYAPHEYVVLKRINEAKTLLRGTNMPVKEIAYRCGYNSEVNFITSFKKNTGVSPSAFRGPK